MSKTANLLNLLKNAGSVRKFTTKSISKTSIDRIIEAGKWGPSVLAIQPWFFAIISKFGCL